MKSFISKLIKSSLLSSLGLIILGVLLIIQSEATIITISYIVGAILIAIGLLAMIRYTKRFEDPLRNELDIVYGLVCIILGILVITNPQAIASIIPFITGFIIIINSAAKLQYSIELKREKDSLWKTTMILSLITIICGLVLIFNPFKGAILLTRIVGILIIIYALLDIISTITIRRTLKRIHKEIEEKIEEADVVEDMTALDIKDKKKIKDKKEKEKDNSEEEE